MYIFNHRESREPSLSWKINAHFFYKNLLKKCVRFILYLHVAGKVGVLVTQQKRNLHLFQPWFGHPILKTKLKNFSKNKTTVYTSEVTWERLLLLRTEVPAGV